MRRTVADCELGGCRIPEGAIVVIAAPPTHSRRDNRGADAAEFRPERWLRQAHPSCPVHAFLPFGLEPRGCSWGGFSERMFVDGLASLAQDSRLELAPGASIEKVNFGNGLKGMLAATVTARPAG